MKDRISRSLEYDRERRNDRLWQKTLKTMAVRKEIVRNTKGMQKCLGHSIGYGKKETVHSRDFWKRYCIKTTLTDRTLQQAITQQLVPIYESLFAEGSYGYRPNRSAKDAILKVKEYAEQGYTFVVVLDLSKYFDTLNHEILINLLRKNVKDERVVQLIKRYLKSGVMENGVAIDTEEGSPQGGLCRARHNPPYDEIDVMPRYIRYL